MTNKDNIPKLVKDVVKVVFNTNSGKTYYVLDEEIYYEYESGEIEYKIDNKYLENKWREKLADKYKVQNFDDINDFEYITIQDVTEIYVTVHNSK